MLSNTVLPADLSSLLFFLCEPIYIDTHDNMYIGGLLNVPDNITLEIIALLNLHIYIVVHVKAS